jgi:hypothetical protein
MLAGVDGVPGADVGTEGEEDPELEEELAVCEGATEEDCVPVHAASNGRSTKGTTIRRRMRRPSSSG